MNRIAAALPTATVARNDRLRRAGILALVGGVLVFLVGFSHPMTLHNAAHDARHSFATPCH